MEVTTVSPSPASPTEGDNLCEIDVSNVAIHSVALLICLCGLAGNGAVLCLLSLKSRTLDIFYLAVADFLFLLLTVPSALLLLVEDLSCSPVLPLMYMSFVFQLSMVSYFWGLYRLILIRDVFSLYKRFQLCCSKNLPERLFLVVATVQDWAVCVIFIVIPVLTFLCPSQEQGLCRAVLFSMYAVILLLFAAPVVISHTINIIRARRGSRKQQPKRRHIVIFITVLFTLILSLCNFLQQLEYFHVSSEVFFLLNCIYSSIKPFIYFLAGGCWRACSMRSILHSLERVSVEMVENAAFSDDAITDRRIWRPVDPFHCSAEGSRHSFP